MPAPRETAPGAHVIDGTLPLLTASNFFDHERDLRAGGLTAFAPTVASIESYDVAMGRVREWHELAARPDEPIKICATPGDLERARSRGQIGVVLHLQGADPIEGDLERLRHFAEAGIRVMQPTYNYANLLGTGALASETSGLTEFGRAAVRRMGELGMVPDVSHASERTALDTLEVAEGVVIASHSNADGRYSHPRNVSDGVIKEIAAHGGVIGVCAFPGFLCPTSQMPTADDIIDHALYIADLVGEEHVSLGTDFADEDEEDFAFFGYDPKFYPPFPVTYPAGIATFRDLPSFAERAESRGLSSSFIAGLMGNNYARVLGAVA